MIVVSKIYESASDTAKKVRKELKNNFPGVKFSIRSSSYSGGSSVRVTWIDGPARKAVEEIAQRFSGASFDGMTDMKSYKGYEYEGQIYSGADYVFCERELSDEYMELIKTTGILMYGAAWEERPYQLAKVEEELTGKSAC